MTQEERKLFAPDSGSSRDYLEGIREFGRSEDIPEAIRTAYSRLENNKKEYLENVTKRKELHKQFLLEPRAVKKDTKPFLYVLKQWNSYTPSLPPEDWHTGRKGGGYYLYCDDYGLVIDPGFNFIQNFLSQGFKLADINGVLISHAHNDHTIELEQICSLLERKNREKGYAQSIDIYFNLGSFKKYAALFDLGAGAPNYIKKIVLLNPHQQYKISSGFSFFTTTAKHHEVITAHYSLGFIFQCGEKLVRYTADTAWKLKQERENRDQAFAEAGLDLDDGVDVLLAHVGTIEEKEFDYDFGQELEVNEDRVFYEKHLGLLGTIAMIKLWRPKLAVLAEFGEELDLLRVPLSEDLQHSTGVRVVPGDIGLAIRLEDHAFWCQQCGRWEPIEELIFKRASRYQKVVYFGSNCVQELERQDVVERVAESPKKVEWDEEKEYETS